MIKKRHIFLSLLLIASSAFCASAEEKEIGILRMLLARDASLLNAQRGPKRDTFLTKAINERKAQVVNFLLQQPNITIDPMSILRAASNGDTNIVQSLLDAGANIEAKGLKNITPLIVATDRGHSDTAQLLLDRGANIEAQMDKGSTPLIIATDKGHLDIVKILLDKGANIKAARDTGNTPLLLAAFHGHMRIAQLLLDREANIHHLNKEGSSPFMMAINSGNTDLAELFLERGSAINTTNIYNVTPLLIAVLKHNFSMAKRLAAKYPEALSLPNTQNLTPFDILTDFKRRFEISKPQFKYFKNKVGTYTSQLTENEIRKAIKALEQGGELKPRVEKPQEKKKGPAFTPAKPQKENLEPARADSGPKDAMSVAEARAAGLLPDRSSPESSIDIKLSRTLREWNREPQQVLKKYGYLNPHPTSDQEIRRRIYEQVAQKTDNPEQAIIDAHTLVPVFIMRYLLEQDTHKNKRPNSTFEIHTPITIMFPDKPELKGTYELFFAHNENSYNVFHSLFKDNKFRGINLLDSQTENFQPVSSSSSSSDEEASAAATSAEAGPKKIRSSEWQIVQESVIPQEKNGNIIFTDPKTGITFIIPAPPA